MVGKTIANGMWTDFSWWTLALVWLGGFLGGMATGAAGFAYGAVATSVWLHAISPVHAAFLVVSIGLINQAGLIWSMRRSLDFGKLSPFLIGGAAGVPIGVALVVKTNPGAIKLALATFMVVYGAYALVAPRLPRIAWGGKPADGAVGLPAACLAARPASREYCRRSGRSCAAGRGTSRAVSTSRSSYWPISCRSP
jgi:uncharacterized membrane protein YfcA